MGCVLGQRKFLLLNSGCLLLYLIRKCDEYEIPKNNELVNKTAYDAKVKELEVKKLTSIHGN